MSIDLSKCKPNQKVVTREGKIGIFVGCSGEVPWPYQVSFNASIVGYTEKGYFIGPSENNRDIVAVLPLEESVTPNSKLLEENAKLKAQLADWDRTLRASVSDENKNCTSPVGAAQAEIADLEQEVGMLKAELESVKRQLDLLLSLG